MIFANITRNESTVSSLSSLLYANFPAFSCGDSPAFDVFGGDWGCPQLSSIYSPSQTESLIKAREFAWGGSTKGQKTISTNFLTGNSHTFVLTEKTDGANLGKIKSGFVWKLIRQTFERKICILSFAVLLLRKSFHSKRYFCLPNQNLPLLD